MSLLNVGINMNDLMTLLRVSSFEQLLIAYEKVNGGKLDFDVIDGGAGVGQTSRQMQKYLSSTRTVFAFEPYPGNHKFFKYEESKIVLVKKALAEIEKKMTFRVPSVVSDNSTWGKQGYAGYSSVGYLATGNINSATDIEVDCVDADNEIPVTSNVGFIKLDLQGGELNALQGMKKLLRNTKLMWIEFTNQPGMLDFLTTEGFIIFDTEYFLMGEKSYAALAEFDISKPDITLSTGQHAWFGFRKYAWHNYSSTFEKQRNEHKLVQTDLVCVNRSFFGDFMLALKYL